LSTAFTFEFSELLEGAAMDYKVDEQRPPLATGIIDTEGKIGAENFARLLRITKAELGNAAGLSRRLSRGRRAQTRRQRKTASGIFSRSSSA
jgi:hypothetical protein